MGAVAVGGGGVLRAFHRRVGRGGVEVASGNGENRSLRP
jgi:hypothetical protein